MLGRLFSPVDIASLVWFRILLGGLIAWDVMRTVAAGKVESAFIAPAFHFQYFGFGWVTPWSATGMRVHFAMLGVLAVCVAAGAAFRLTAPLLAAAYTYMFLLDQAEYQNHYYLVCLFTFLLALTPAHRAFSVDAWRHPRLRSATAPAWSLWVSRVQLLIVYFMGGVAKLNADWLAGEPMRMWLRDRPDFPFVGGYFETAAAPFLFAYAGLIIDLGLPALLLFRRSRPWGFVLAVLFHATNARLLAIGIFPPLALGATLVLFASELPRPWPVVTSDRGPVERPFLRRAGTVLLIGWVTMQVVVPLRHLFFYSGNPEWTEEGHRFSWRMKLRDKTGYASFAGHDPRTGREWPIDPLDYVTAEQFSEAVDRPDMLLQLAHWMATDAGRREGALVEVRVTAVASLNGRPLRPLIDPTVDLGHEPRTLRPARWILPLTEPLPARR